MVVDPWSGVPTCEPRGERGGREDRRGVRPTGPEGVSRGDLRVRVLCAGAPATLRQPLPSLLPLCPSMQHHGRSLKRSSHGAAVAVSWPKLITAAVARLGDDSLGGRQVCGCGCVHTSAGMAQWKGSLAKKSHFWCGEPCPNVFPWIPMGKWWPDSHGRPRRGQVDLSYAHPSNPRGVESFYIRFLQLPLDYGRVAVHSRCNFGDTLLVPMKYP
eukprot:331086-Chlamydomonas_euryale.AAC.1